MFLIIHFKFVVSLMCMTFCLIIKCLSELNFMQFYTFNVLETEVEWLLYVLIKKVYALNPVVLKLCYNIITSVKVAYRDPFEAI